MPGHIGLAGNLDWNTPESIVAPTLETFGGVIDLDPCSNAGSIVPARVKYMLPEHDGLKDPWLVCERARIYVNPPFGRCFMDANRQVLSQKEYTALPADEKRRYRSTTILDWVKRAQLAFQNQGGQIIMLCPVAVSTKHWQRHILLTAPAICYVSGRLKFLGAPAGAPMDCAVVYWGPDVPRFRAAFAKVGTVVDMRAERLSAA